MDKKGFSILFLFLAVLFTVCLVASNLFEIKVFTICGLSLTGGLLLFPVSYVLNDCIVEVWGYGRARLVIWTAFVMDFFVMASGSLVAVLPDAPFWEGGEHFDYVFAVAPRIVLASLLAFFAGSTLNAMVMSRMKSSSGGRGFTLRAVVSTVAGESVDSLVFFPIAFWGMGFKEMLKIMLLQIVLKTLYEVAVLPVTVAVVNWMKKKEGTDVIDSSISYNPFRIGDYK